MNLKDLSARVDKLLAKHGRPARLPSVITFQVEDGPPSAEDIARRFPGVAGGCMLVPVFGDGSIEAWEAAAVESQRRLKAAVRD